MAISYVGGKVAGTAGQGGGSIDLTTGLEGGSGGAPIAGDLVVVTVSVGTAARAPTIAISTPTGYTALTAQRTTATTYDTNVQTCYKVMTATPDTAVTIPASGNNADGIAYSIQVFRGVDTTTPMDATATYATGTATNNLPNGAAITPVTSGAWIVVCGGGAAASGGTYAAAALTNFLTANGPDTNDGNVGAGYFTGWTSGAYDPVVWTGGSANAGNSWGCTTLALRPAPNAYVTTAQAGSYTLTGQAATVSRDKALAATAGSYTLSGVNATLTFTPLITGYDLTALAGAYLLTGQAATVSRDKLLTASAGSYTLTGVNADLTKSKLIAASAGSYTVSGQSADLAYLAPGAYVLTALAGSYAITGSAATIAAGGAAHEVVLLGGGPGRLDKSSYWYRLLSPPLQDKLEVLEPEIIEVIEEQVIAAAEKPDNRAEMQQIMQNMGIAYKEAYQEIYLELLAEMHQVQEDEQIAAIVAALL